MQRSNKLRSVRLLTLEPLESRLPLAGNVTAAVVDGRLSIIGDAHANEIVIEETFLEDDLSEFAGRGRFQVRGLVGTTINGGSNGFFSIEHVSDILVNLGRGDDRVVIGAVGVVGTLAPTSYLVTDPISRLIEQGPVLVGSAGNANLVGQLKINLSEGNDTAIVFATAGAGIAIEAGSGDDEFYYVDDAAHFTSQLRIRMGEGNDLASVTVFNANQQIDLQTANGNDTVFATLATPTQLAVHTGIGDDGVRIARLEGGRWLSSPPGDRQIVVRTGLGNDKIDVARVSARNLLINAGLGRDAVEVSTVDVTGNVTIHGGGLYGSTVKVSDRYIEPLGYTSTSPAAIRYSPVRIGGNLQIDFNVDSQEPHQPRTAFSVVLGAVDQSPTLSDAIVVGGRLRVFGTIHADDLSLARLTAGSIELHTGHGWDAVSMAGVRTTSGVAIFLGNGDDRSLIVEDSRTPSGSIVPTTIGGDLLVDYGAGDDQFSSITVATSLTQNFRIGATHSQLTSNFVVRGQLSVSGGAGQDDLQLLAATLGSATLQFGAGRSSLDWRFVLVVGDADVIGSFDIDAWGLSAFGVGGNLTLQGRSGANNISVNGGSNLPSHVGGNILFHLGDGDDRVRVAYDSSVVVPNGSLSVDSSQAWPFPFPFPQTGVEPGGGPLTVGGRFTLTGGGGDDNVSLDHLDVHGQLFAFLGNGGDLLQIQDTTSAGGVIDGGLGGNDRVEGNYQSARRPLLRTNWEVDNLFSE